MPTLAHMTTALKSGVSYEDKSKEFFTADSGIENGLWRIKYNLLGPDYDPYDFGTVWSYETDPLNNLTADITVQNVWVPSNVTLGSLGLSPAQAKAIIESEKLIITGTSGTEPGKPYHIKMDFTPAESDNLTIKSIGIWLPQGFIYNASNCTLLDDPFVEYYPELVSETVVPGGRTVIWSYNEPYPLFTSFPNFDIIEQTMTVDFAFTYTPPASNPTKLPVAVAWVLTDMDPSCPNPDDVPIAWDTDARIYKITSATGETSIEAYSTKSQLRNLGNGIPGDYAAIGNSVMADYYSPYDKRDTLLGETSTNLADVSPIPTDGDVLYAYLYWSGFRHDTNLFSDTCSSGNLSASWLNGGDWAYYSSSPYYYRGQHTGADSRRYLTMSNGLNLGEFPSGTQYEISWSQSVAALSEDIFSDGCSNFNNWNPGAAWEIRSNQYFQAKSTASEDDTTRLLTLNSGQDLSSYSSVTISWDQRVSGAAAAGDGLDFALSSDNGSTWSTYTQAFRGDIGTSWVNKSYTIPVDFGSEYLTNGFMIKFKLVGFTGSVYCRIDNIKITPSYGSLDGLDFAISDNGGTSWSSNIQAFRGDIGTSWSTFTYYLSGSYITSGNFKLRFYLVGMEGSQQYARIDNIKVVVRPPDDSANFKINGQQVYLDSNGDPQAGEQPIVASYSAVMINTAGTSSPGYSYACYKDVSKLVRTYPIVPGEEHHTGNYNYTVGGIFADTGEYVSYAGWSLIVIYSSPTTAGRYIYLRDIRDVFAFNPGGTNLDFDNDGTPGGDVIGFLFPEPVRDKFGTIIDPRAAKITCFVGEGDDIYSGDTLIITGQQSGASKSLSNTSSPSNNVWNSASPGMSYPGVDVDTFEVLWTDGILTPKDTKLHLDMNTGTDAWNLIYVIISVRSEIVTSGTGNYIIGSM